MINLFATENEASGAGTWEVTMADTTGLDLTMTVTLRCASAGS